MSEVNPINPFAIGWESWRHAFRAARGMPLLFLASAALLLPFNGVTVDAWVQMPSRGWPLVAWLIVQAVAHAAVAVPILVVVHRYVLRGEAEARPAVSLAMSRAVRFFGFALVWSAVPALIIAMAYLGVLFERDVLVLAPMALVVPAAAIGVRTLIVFPAIAIDASGASWRNAMADTRGHGWRILATLAVTGIPFVLSALAIAGGWYVLSDVLGLRLARFSLLPLDAAMVVFTTAAFAATASQLYALLARRLEGGGSAPSVGLAVSTG